MDGVSVSSTPPPPPSLCNISERVKSQRYTSLNITCLPQHTTHSFQHNIVRMLSVFFVVSTHATSDKLLQTWDLRLRQLGCARKLWVASNRPKTPIALRYVDISFSTASATALLRACQYFSSFYEQHSQVANLFARRASLGATHMFALQVKHVTQQNRNTP